MKNKVFTILSTVVLIAASAPASLAGSRDDIIKVIQSCPLSPDNCEKGLIVSDIKIVGSYAKASVRSSKGPGETDTAYLRKEGDGWVLLDQGTGVDPEALGIPKKAW